MAVIKEKILRSADDVVIDWVVFGALACVLVVCLVPVLLVLSTSFMPLVDYVKGGGRSLLPTTIDLTAYQALLTGSRLVEGFRLTIILTLVGTALNLLLTISLAYPLSQAFLPGRSKVMVFLVFTMMFSGGLIPTYLVVKATGLLNSFWAMAIPNAVWVSNVIIMKIFFEQLPVELSESARMDGANDLTVLTRVTLPLSGPILATVGLFYGVAHWNQFMDALLYITSQELLPLQYILRDIILSADAASANNPDIIVPGMTLRMAAVVLTTLPVILVYPFLQRYFVKGMTIGAVKG